MRAIADNTVFLRRGCGRACPTVRAGIIAIRIIRYVS